MDMRNEIDGALCAYADRQKVCLRWAVAVCDRCGRRFCDAHLGVVEPSATPACLDCGRDVMLDLLEEGIEVGDPGRVVWWEALCDIHAERPQSLPSPRLRRHGDVPF